jgi:hypothetical protein
MSFEGERRVCAIVPRNLVIFIFVMSILTVSVITVLAEEPNVGILRVFSFVYPKQVAPNSTFQVTVGVEYALHGRPENATIRAAIYRDVVNFSNPLWQSKPEVVTRGGDKLWNATLVSPATEEDLKLTAYAFYLDDGTWNFYNNSMNGPSFSHARIKVGKMANININLGASKVPVLFDDIVVETSPLGEARTMMLAGRSHAVSVPTVVEFQNSTRIVFEGWNDGSNQTQRTVTLNGDVALVGRYKVQYLLKVDYLSSSASEWHDAGSNVTLRAPNYSESNWLVNLGVRENFVGWRGDVNSPTQEIRITMNRPLTVIAVSSRNYDSLIIPCIVGAGLIGTVTLHLLRRKHRGRGEASVSTEEMNLSCGSCGQPVRAEWVHCIKCGADLPKRKPTKS